MALKDKKITGYATSISALPNKVENKASWLKEQFDGRTNAEVKDSVNGIVDELLASTAAEQIGATVPEEITPEPPPEVGQPAKLAAVLRGIVSFVKSFVMGYAYTKAETVQKIDEKIIEIGAGDMAKAVYDKNNNGKVDIAELADKATTATTATTATKATTADNALALGGVAKSGFATAAQGIKADNAISRLGDVFTGDVVAYTLNRTGLVVRNCAVWDSNGVNIVPTDNIRFIRK